MRKSLQFVLAAALGAAIVLPAQADITVASWGGAYTKSQVNAWLVDRLIQKSPI